MDFLQSAEWRKFQEAVGQRTFLVSSDNFYASIIEHRLPVVGKYFYIPRGIIFNFQFSIFNDQSKIFFSELIVLAKREKAGWIRFDSADKKALELIQELIPEYKIIKAPHDMQPREIFLIDIAKAEEELLREMKSKTRYNIQLAGKKGASVKIISNDEFLILNDKNFKYYLDEFIRLVKLTSDRQGIVSHPENYYRQMFEVIPPEIIKLYVAEYEGKVIAANIVIFYPVKSPQGGDGKAVFNWVNNDTAIYLHGASDSVYRNVMAPYLLQWQAIQDAKKAGCVKYDMGGIKTHNANRITRNEKNDTRYAIRDASSWSGITKFKTGFSPKTEPIEFLGSYDIVINPAKYYLYRIIQKIKNLL